MGVCSGRGEAPERERREEGSATRLSQRVRLVVVVVLVRRGEEWEWYRCSGRGEAREREERRGFGDQAFAEGTVGYGWWWWWCW